MTTLRIGEWFQGPTGSGQGGWTAAKLIEVIGQPATVAIKMPIPLETELDVVETGPTRWQLADTSGELVMEAQRWEPTFPTTPSISIDEAVAARHRFPVSPDTHPVPRCFSCGLRHDSMQVHAGPTGDGRFATDWRVPDWAVGRSGTVDEGALWAAIDCTAAWFVCYSDAPRTAFTVQFATEILEPLQAGATYALVAWAGDSKGGWDGRKRSAASAAFDADGTCVARSTSFWVSVG